MIKRILEKWQMKIGDIDSTYINPKIKTQENRTEQNMH